MKTSNLLSNLSPNNSVVLIIFVFLFIAVGMFFLIQRTTEKKEKDEEDKKNRLIEERKELTNQNIKEHMDMGMDMNMDMDMGMKNINQNGGELASDSYTTEENTVTETFNNEVGLFIKKDKTHPEMYSHNPIYIPPFNTGKETRCVSRHINRPDGTMNVQSCSSSDLVKISSDASY
jgi:hypothetical protein